MQPFAFLASMMLPQRSYGSTFADVLVALVVLAVLTVTVVGLVALARMSSHGPRHHTG